MGQGGAGWGLNGAGGWDVQCWQESGFEPNGLCRFEVKNMHGL